MSELTERLVEICGPRRVSDRMADRICHTRDCGPSPGGIPAVVARPLSTEEVVAIVKLANELKTPIFVWGRSTTFIGAGVPEGCILLALDLMDEIEAIDFESQVVTVGPGAIWHAVDTELNKQGWELAVAGPGGMFSCTIGGSVAYNSVPHGITEYGMTGDHVVSLEVVLPNGEVINTGSAANVAAGGLAFERYANGPDVTGLFIGACGTLGIITKVSFRIRRVPAAERFLFYGFDDYNKAVDAAQAIQTQRAATFLIGLFGGPNPVGIDGDAFLHIIIRDNPLAADERRGIAAAICESFGGKPLDWHATESYWVGHMYSWLRNYPPETYYSHRPYGAPEMAGFVPTQKVKDTIRYLREYEVSHREEFAELDIRIKCYDVYFSPNGAFVWIDTLYPEEDPESWQYGVNLRATYAEDLCSQFMSPGGILQALAPVIMPKLGPGFEFLKFLKAQLDPNYILNPGVLLLQPEGSQEVKK
jgi:FAD/FMN-containing dehydrogenase